VCSSDLGSREDLAVLAPFHYRPGAPATIERVFRATDPETGTLAGVLVTSRPTLNGAWRKYAWPEVFATGDRKLDARTINHELRTISRVIIDPRFRGLGLASSLVRRYLESPETRCTEAIAAMGGVCPFFKTAGMVEYKIPPTERHARLADALAHAGIEPWRLATPDLALARAVRNAGEAFVEHELRLWARSSGSTANLLDAPLIMIFRSAALHVFATPRAYAHAVSE